MVNRIWPTAVAGKADSVSSVSASACHIGGPNCVNLGQILLVYGTFFYTNFIHSIPNVRSFFPWLIFFPGHRPSREPLVFEGVSFLKIRLIKVDELKIRFTHYHTIERLYVERFKGRAYNGGHG